MKFEKDRVYTVANADELKQGDKVIVAGTLRQLKKWVGKHESVETIESILPEEDDKRFVVEEYTDAYALAYLIERKKNCTNCRKMSPFYGGCEHLGDYFSFLTDIDRQKTFCCGDYVSAAEKHQNCSNCIGCENEKDDTYCCEHYISKICIDCANKEICKEAKKYVSDGKCAYKRKKNEKACGTCARSKHGGDRTCVLEEFYCCDDYKPRDKELFGKTEQLKTRPFRDTSELIKVWDEKYKEKYGLERLDKGLAMPDIWVRRKGGDTRGQLITKFSDTLWVELGREGYNMTDLWVHFTFLDGSLCGVEL